MTLIQASFLRERSYVSVALTHFFVDVLNSGRNLLIAILAINLGFNNAQLGVNLIIYNIGSALTQPLFGWLADKIGARLLVIGGIAWMIFFFGLAAILGDWPAFVVATIAGLGSGAFHPTGTMVASQISVRHPAQATAVFFMCGQLGLFAGPILTGVVLELYGRPGYLILPLLALTALLSGWQWLRNRPEHTFEPQPASSPPTIGLKRQTTSYILLPMIILTYSSVGIAAMTFSPKLFTELGYDPGYVGWLSGLFMLGSAMGGIVGGALADRFSSKWIMTAALLASVIPIYFYIPVDGITRFVLLIVAGFFSGMPHSILILMAQSLLPGRRALASGLALGGLFFSGSFGSYLLGIVADNAGLALTLQGTAVLPIITAMMTMLLVSESVADITETVTSTPP